MDIILVITLFAAIVAAVIFGRRGGLKNLAELKPGIRIALSILIIGGSLALGVLAAFALAALILQ